MGINVFPVPSSAGKTFKRQIFTNSGTWTAPTSANYDGLVTVTAVGGGGGGGGGGGACNNNTSSGNNDSAWIGGGCGGGGGGGGQVVTQTVPVTAGTAVTVTVGAGGTGGQVDTTQRTYNYITNPSFEVNATSWSAVSNCTISRTTTTYPTISFGSQTASLALNYTASSYSFSHDTGNSAFTANSGTTGYGLVYAFRSSISATATITAAWYANASLIRTDTLASNSANFFYDTSGAWTYVGNMYTSSAIPSNATRLVLTFSLTAGNASGTSYIDALMLIPNEFMQDGAGYPPFNSSTSGYYWDPEYLSSATNASKKTLVWAGTANNSCTLVNGTYGSSYNLGSLATTDHFFGCSGAAGANGGDTTFGSYLTAKGGGGGGGGRGAVFTNMLSIKSSRWAVYDGYRFANFTLNRAGNGGNGGGQGGLWNGEVSGGYSYSYLAGGGGGGAGGWGPIVQRITSTGNLQPNNPILVGGRALNYSGGGASYYPGAKTGAASASDYAPHIGGLPLNNLAAGGNGGQAGGAGASKDRTGTGNYTYSDTYYYTGSSPAIFTDLTNYYHTGLWPSAVAAGGATKYSAYPSSGGAVSGSTNAGANATLYGSGGGGGAGAASTTTTTLGGTTWATPPDGGVGGNGSNGYVLVEWWE